MTDAKLDIDRIDGAALAVLSLTLHDTNRVWKGLDWEVLARLHEKGLITNPVGKAKSVYLTEDGIDEAARQRAQLFMQPGDGQ